MVGVVSYGSGQGIPLAAGCNATSWTSSANGVIVWVPPNKGQLEEPVTLAATGGSSCAFLADEGGTMSLSASTATSSCMASGAYLRVGLYVLAVVGGSCQLSVGTTSATVVINDELVPQAVQSTSGGTQVSTAAVAGHLAIYPSGV
jgi:hypothetical protein